MSSSRLPNSAQSNFFDILTQELALYSANRSMLARAFVIKPPAILKLDRIRKTNAERMERLKKENMDRIEKLEKIKKENLEQIKKDILSPQQKDLTLEGFIEVVNVLLETETDNDDGHHELLKVLRAAIPVAFNNEPGIMEFFAKLKKYNVLQESMVKLFYGYADKVNYSKLDYVNRIISTMEKAGLASLLFMPNLDFLLHPRHTLLEELIIADMVYDLPKKLETLYQHQLLTGVIFLYLFRVVPHASDLEAARVLNILLMLDKEGMGSLLYASHVFKYYKILTADSAYKSIVQTSEQKKFDENVFKKIIYRCVNTRLEAQAVAGVDIICWGAQAIESAQVDFPHKDLYRFFGVKPTASIDKIMRVVIEKTEKIAVDPSSLSGDVTLILEALDTLNNATSRKAYDRYYREHFAPASHIATYASLFRVKQEYFGLSQVRYSPEPQSTFSYRK